MCSSQNISDIMIFDLDEHTIRLHLLYKFYIIYKLDTLITMLFYWQLFLIFCTKALPSGLIFAVNYHAFLITSSRSPKELLK